MSRNKLIIYLPKEFYPTDRSRIKELYQNEFVSLGNKIFWIFQTNNNIRNYDNNRNIFYIYKGNKSQNIDRIINRIIRLKKIFIINNIIHKEKVDIIIVSDGIIEAYIGLIISRLYKIKFVFFLTSEFVLFDKVNIKKNINIKSYYKYIESIIKNKLYIYIIKKCDIFHPISKYMGMKYAKYNNNCFPLPTCPNNIFFQNKKNKYSNFHNHKIKLIYIGTIHKMRNIDLMIDIIYLLKQRNYGWNINLLIIGKIEDKKYLHNLIKKINRLKLNENIIIKKEVNKKTLIKIMIEKDIGLSLIPPIDGYIVSSPTKCIEYMALGIPVIANEEILDQQEIILNSEGGFLVKYDKIIIVDKIESIMKNKYNLQNIGDNGRKWVINHRNYKYFAIYINNIYDKLLEGRVINE